MFNKVVWWRRLGEVENVFQPFSDRTVVACFCELQGSVNALNVLCYVLPQTHLCGMHDLRILLINLNLRLISTTVNLDLFKLNFSIKS